MRATSSVEKGSGRTGRIGRLRPMAIPVGYDQTGTFDPERGNPVGVR